MPLESGRRFLVSLNRWEKLALAAWSVLLLFVCCRTAFWPEAHSVYPIFALASQKWRAGHNLYILTKYDVYRYSPLVAAAFVPLGLLPGWLGGVLWRLLSAGVYLGALTWWGRAMMRPAALVRLAERDVQGAAITDKTWLALLLLLVIPLSLDNLNNGQSNVLM